jgi:hypothetical protein
LKWAGCDILCRVSAWVPLSGVVTFQAPGIDSAAKQL